MRRSQREQGEIVSGRYTGIHEVPECEEMTVIATDILGFGALAGLFDILVSEINQLVPRPEQTTTRTLCKACLFPLLCVQVAKT